MKAVLEESDSIKNEITLVKACEGLEVRTSGLVLLTTSLEVITAEALVASRKARYFGFDKKVMSPFLASLIPATPVIETSALPTISPPTSSAIFLSSRLLDGSPLFFLCVGIIQNLDDRVRQITAFALINQHAVVKNIRIALGFSVILNHGFDFL